MPRPRQRVCLQDGLKLDLNRLIRQGTVRPGTRTGPYLFRWTNNYTGEVVASGEITSDLCSREEGPRETFWTMYDRELWAIGYPKCK